jgi:hypothetical protein
MECGDVVGGRPHFQDRDLVKVVQVVKAIICGLMQAGLDNGLNPSSLYVPT